MPVAMTIAVMQHVPVAESNAAFPLVIFSHGIGGNRMAYSAIICSLVRQVSVTFLPYTFHMHHVVYTIYHVVPAFNDPVCVLVSQPCLKG